MLLYGKFRVKISFILAYLFILNNICIVGSPSRRTCVQDFYFLKKKPPANLASRSEHVTPRPPTLFLTYFYKYFILGVKLVLWLNLCKLPGFTLPDRIIWISFFLKKDVIFYRIRAATIGYFHCVQSSEQTKEGNFVVGREILQVVYCCNGRAEGKFMKCII